MVDEAVLYYLPISHYCVSVDRMLAFKGLPYRKVPTTYHDRRALLQATGQDYVPTLVWNGTPVVWHQIPEFLEEAKPTPTLYPGNSKALATTLENWGHQVLEERVWRAVVTQVPQVLGEGSERWVFEEMQTRARGPWHVLEARRAEFWDEMLQYLQMVEGMVSDRPWILREPSLADFGIYGGLSPLLTVGDSIPENLPHLAEWARRIAMIGAAPAAPPPTPSTGRKGGGAARRK